MRGRESARGGIAAQFRAEQPIVGAGTGGAGGLTPEAVATARIDFDTFERARVVRREFAV